MGSNSRIMSSIGVERARLAVGQALELEDLHLHRPVEQAPRRCLLEGQPRGVVLVVERLDPRPPVLNDRDSVPTPRRRCSGRTLHDRVRQVSHGSPLVSLRVRSCGAHPATTAPAARSASVRVLGRNRARRGSRGCERRVPALVTDAVRLAGDDAGLLDEGVRPGDRVDVGVEGPSGHEVRILGCVDHGSVGRAHGDVVPRGEMPPTPRGLGGEDRLQLPSRSSRPMPKSTGTLRTPGCRRAGPDARSPRQKLLPELRLDAAEEDVLAIGALVELVGGAGHLPVLRGPASSDRRRCAARSARRSRRSRPAR